MGLKLLHSADWHLDSAFSGFSDEQRAALKGQQRKLPEKIADLCRREQCDLMLLAGDLFDGIPSRETVARLKTVLRECGVPVLIAPGNHDFCGPGSPWLEESWPENVHVFTGKMESVVFPELDCRVYGAGFQGMDCPGLLESFRAEGKERYCLAVLHGDPMQKNSPYNPITAAQVRDSALDYLALGHIHKAGAFRAGNTLCAWPGCPMGRGWDETGEKGVCIVTLAEEVQIQTVKLDVPTFYEMEVEVSGDGEAALEAVLPAQGGGDYYRVTLIGWSDVDTAALKQKLRAFPNLELRDHTRPPVDLWEGIGEDTLEGIFFGMLRQAMDAQPELRERIRLAAEISRKLLSGSEVEL
ncbi:MAG: DNA repair exonuclease [Oscillospiraceae bacterium]|nr:DNA repair exonuclease [Oscillospiraceae bacterium]